MYHKRTSAARGATLTAVALSLGSMIGPRALSAQQEGTAPAGRQVSAGDRNAPDGQPWQAVPRNRPDPNLWVNGALGLVALIALDTQIRGGVQDWQGSFGNAVADAAEPAGDWHVAVPVVAAVSLLGGSILEGDRGLRKGLALIMGVAAGSMASEAVNQMTGRARPGWGRGSLSFDPFSGHASFPSGHTALAFSIAGSLDAVTESEVAALVGYGVAGLTGWSRMYDDKHWASDVAIGALVGALVGAEAARTAMDIMGVGPASAQSCPVAASTCRESSAGLRVRLVAEPGFVGVRIPH